MCAANLETFAWTGNFEKDLPWHMSKNSFYGYGGEDPLTADAMIRQAGLDWRVNLHPSAVEIDGVIYKSQEFFNIVRDSDKKILGCVSEKYQPIQNSEGFSFLDSVVGELGNLRYVTAGAIDGGKRIWLMAQIIGVDDLEPVLGDKSKSFLLLSSGHDGKNSLKCKFTTVRIVCQNTLNLALRTGEEGITIKHIGDLDSKVLKARQVLGLATQEIEEFRKVSSWLAAQRSDISYTRDFLEEMAPTVEKTDKAKTRAENIQKELLKLSVLGFGTHIPGVTGTRWALLNAVTEYNTHHRNFRDTKQSGGDTNKFDALFGGGVGEKMNQKALDFLIQDIPASIYQAPKRALASV